MADERIKKIRQLCVSVMVLCLAFLGVFVIQEKTGVRKAVAEVSEDLQNTMGEDAPVLTGKEVQGGGHGSADVEGSAWSQIFGSYIPEVAKQQGDTCVLVRKNGAVLESVTEKMIFRQLTVKMQGTVSEEDIYRVSGESLYSGVPQVPVVIIPEEFKNVPLVREPDAPGEDLLLSLEVKEKNGGTEVVLEFNSVYEVSMAEDAEFYYFNLVRPHEKYDKIVVIDAGHGGNDTGTHGGGVDESTVNLAVVHYLKELLDQQTDWEVYYTRLNNSMIDLSTRVEYINALHADMIISVHCNHNPVSSVNGVEVLYSEKQGTDVMFNSRYLAELCSIHVTEATGLKRRPLVERSSNLHIIKYCTMPMALIEFGYMSNEKDLAKITTEQTQRECAEAIYRVIEDAYEALEQTEK